MRASSSGHGQMDADELEEVMTTFVNGEADVLLSTTIIESGLDIPNANTIIIDRADRFGLSDLYQLRGRVGRYKHQAYAYLLLPRHAGLLADARKRITRASSNIRRSAAASRSPCATWRSAARAICSAPEQSGHITAVGFELYCQLLKQSVASLKGEKVKPRVEVQVRFDFLALNPGEEETQIKNENVKSKMEEPRLEISIPREVATYTSYDDDAEPAARKGRSTRNPEPGTRNKASAFIPLAYIAEPRQRIEVYRKLAQANEKPALESLRTELRDRFGPLPPAMELLLQVAELKILASERGITVMEVKEDRLMLTRNNDYLMLGGKFPRLTKPDATGILKEIKKLLLAI